MKFVPDIVPLMVADAAQTGPVALVKASVPEKLAPDWVRVPVPFAVPPWTDATVNCQFPAMLICAAEVEEELPLPQPAVTATARSANARMVRMMSLQRQLKELTGALRWSVRDGITLIVCRLIVVMLHKMAGWQPSPLESCLAGGSASFEETAICLRRSWRNSRNCTETTWGEWSAGNEMSASSTS